MARKTAKESILQERTVKTPKVSVKSDERNRSLKKISIISTALIVAICIVFNILLDLTLDKKLTFDATSVQQNTVSILTKNFIEKLDKKVEIIGLFNRNNAISDWKDYCLPLLDDYESKADGMIELKYIDPDVDPFILKQLDPDNLYGLRKDTYVIRCGDLLTTVDPYSCFVYDANMLQYYNLAIPTTNNLEREFTGRIMYVTSGRALHAYYLSGHNLPTHYYLDQILKSLGFASSEITLKGQS